MKKKSNKSQTTIFIILGIIIITLIIFLTIPKINDKVLIPQNIEPINNFVEECIKQTSNDAITILGLSAGYFPLPELTTQTNIPIYYKDNTVSIPTIEKLQTGLSDLIIELLPFCTNNFVNFNDFKIEENSNEIKITSIIKDKKIIINTLYPLKIKKEDQTYELKNFKTITNAPLGKSYNIAKQIIKDQQVNPSTVCITCLSNLADKYDLIIGFDDTTNNQVIYTIVDDKTEINEEGFTYLFASELENAEETFKFN